MSTSVLFGNILLLQFLCNNSPVFELSGISSPISAVVIVGTGIALPAQTWRLGALLGFVVGQNKIGVCKKGEQKQNMSDLIEYSVILYPLPLESVTIPTEISFYLFFIVGLH